MPQYVYRASNDLHPINRKIVESLTSEGDFLLAVVAKHAVSAALGGPPWTDFIRPGVMVAVTKQQLIVSWNATPIRRLGRDWQVEKPNVLLCKLDQISSVTLSKSLLGSELRVVLHKGSSFLLVLGEQVPDEVRLELVRYLGG